MDPAALNPSDASSTTTINDLPDDLLGRVLALAGRRECRVAAGACRRLRRLFYTEPALWRSLHLNRAMSPFSGADKLDSAVMAHLPLLRRVAGLLQHLSICCEADSVMAAALSSLQPATLPSLCLSISCRHSSSRRGVRSWDDIFNWDKPASMAATFQALAGLTALTRLQLLCDVQPSELPAALCSLPHLSGLLISTLHSSGVSAELGPALRHLAPRLTQLRLNSVQVPTSVADVLGVLACLRSLRLRSSSIQPDIAAAVTQLAALEALWLEFTGDSPDLEGAAALWAPASKAGQLPQLSSLRLRARDVLPAQLVEAVARQTQLTELALQAVLGDVLPLSTLQQLRRLTLCDVGDDEAEGPVPQLPPPCCFAALEAYSFSSSVQWLVDTPYRISLGDAYLHSCTYEGGRRTQRAFEFIDGGWDSLLNSWDEPDEQEDPAEDGGTGGRLTVCATSQTLPPFDQLAAVLLPPGVLLQELHFEETDPPPAAVLGSTRIAALQCLKIEGSPGILNALPQELLHLTRLVLTGKGPATGLQPGQLPSMPALKDLELARCIDSSGGSAIDACMPALLSQDIEGLEFLNLSGNMFTRLPPSLAAATRLKYLELSNNSNLDLTAEDTDQILARMPVLQYLGLNNNSVERLPPSLAAATSLTSLGLSNNSGLVITEDDVQQVLARMPRLQHLWLYHSPNCLTDSLKERAPATAAAQAAASVSAL
ncbi:volume-regulated anion channel subunit LRRC8E-like [Chlorella sorokiniana]|uniref:Volume-regulated anion channel subunit LRRC8E-like n=1 Tax=Chlorella sorokiniana TaxID=3076 RepID=A0A2P6TBD1_CHLSO|nr:volume-regulated anion channel subunit LRRC8E-like [Chlorella sorokiniana]|eukprot:PRW05858.1 volume-regulated anion channel subunit LRRC8E-like [Chlorella sorokiniana]